MDEELHYVVYVHDNNKSRCKIGNSICKIFDLAGKFDELNNSTMKINCHFTATKNINILWKKLMADMRKWENKIHNCHYDALQAKIIWKIIKFINPKYMILEGSGAFKDLNKFAKLVNIPYTLRDYNSKLIEAEYDINNGQKILAVQFKRNINGLVKNLEIDMVNWLKEH